MPKPKECNACPLFNNALVKYSTGRSRVVFVAQSPGIDEARQGEVLIGRAGQLFNNILSKVGLQRSNFHLCNALLCYEKSGALKPSEINTALTTCRPNLTGYLQDTVKPQLIVTMGAYALKTILHKDKIVGHRGKFYWSEEFQCPVFVILHPAAILRECHKDYPNIDIAEMSMRERDFYRDFQTLANVLKSKDYKKWDFKDMKADFKEGHIVTPKINTDNYVWGTVADAKKIRASKMFAFDTEATHVDLHRDDTIPISISFTIETGKSYVFPLSSIVDGIPNISKKAFKLILEALADPNIVKIVAARPFDENLIKRFFGVTVKGRIFDVLTMAHVDDENYHQYNLQTVASQYGDMQRIKDLAEGFRHQLKTATPDVIRQYNGVDSDSTFRSFQKLMSRIANFGDIARYYNKFIMPVQDALAKISHNGCHIDADRLEHSCFVAETELTRMENEMQNMLPRVVIRKYSDENGDVSFTKKAMIQHVIFKSLRCKPHEDFLTEKKREPKLTKQHLKMFKHKPFVVKYLEWSELHKIYTSYLMPLWRLFEKGITTIYPSTILTRTVTGRTVMNDPPIQTYPQRGKWAHLIKECLIATPGWMMGARDLKTSEMRIVGWLAGDSNILDAVNQGVDLHTKTASVVTLKPVDEITSKMRRDAKPINFGLVYGMQAKNLKQYLKDEYDIDMSSEECEQIRNRYFAYPTGYHKLLNYYDEVRTEIRRDGYVASPLGRRRRFPAAVGSMGYIGHMDRRAINFPVQSFSSDLGLIGLMLFTNYLEKKNLTAHIKPMWFIHDSIIFQAKAEYMDRAMEILKYCMEKLSVEYIEKFWGIKLGYPVETDGKIGKNWANMLEVEEVERGSIYW